MKIALREGVKKKFQKFWHFLNFAGPLKSSDGLYAFSVNWYNTKTADRTESGIWYNICIFGKVVYVYVVYVVYVMIQHWYYWQINISKLIQNWHCWQIGIIQLVQYWHDVLGNWYNTDTADQAVFFNNTIPILLTEKE